MIILLIPGLIIGGLSYTTAKDAVETEIIAGASQNISLLNSTITHTIQPKMDDVSTFSKWITSNQYNEELQIRSNFQEYMELHPDAEAIYVGTNSGQLVIEPNISLPADFDVRDRDWYKLAMEQKGEMILSEPYLSASTGEMVLTMSQTTEDGSGVVGVDISIVTLQTLVASNQIGSEGYAVLIDQNKSYIAHPIKDASSQEQGPFIDQMFEGEAGTFDYGEKKVLYTTNSTTGWKLAGVLMTDEIKKAAAPIFNKTGIVLLVSYLIGAILVFFVIKSILKPINQLKVQAQNIQNGDLTQKTDIKTKDEIGQLGLAFNEMQDSLRAMVQKMEQNAELVAASAEQLTASADQTSVVTEHVSGAIQEVASSTETQTNRVSQNIQALQRVSEGVHQITESSSVVSKLAQHTSDQADIGGQVVSNTVMQMSSIQTSVEESNLIIQSLYERSKQVSSILTAVTDIADQTNLLALNAAIEAARAGEHGRGFAVVADEVRKLADQSQNSVKEILEIVQGIQEDTKLSVDIMAQVKGNVQEGVNISQEAIEKFDRINESMKEMNPQMARASSIVQEIQKALGVLNTSSEELSFVAEENAKAAEEVAASTEEQLASMEEITASAKSLAEIAVELKEVTSDYRY